MTELEAGPRGWSSAASPPRLSTPAAAAANGWRLTGQPPTSLFSSQLPWIWQRSRFLFNKKKKYQEVTEVYLM